MFIEAFSRIYGAKVNVISGAEGVADIVVGEQYELEINLLRNEDHFDLLKKPEVCIIDSPLKNTRNPATIKTEVVENEM